MNVAPSPPISTKLGFASLLFTVRSEDSTFWGVRHHVIYADRWWCTQGKSGYIDMWNNNSLQTHQYAYHRRFNFEQQLKPMKWSLMTAYFGGECELVLGSCTLQWCFGRCMNCYLACSTSYWSPEWLWNDFNSYFAGCVDWSISLAVLTSEIRSVSIVWGFELNTTEDLN